MSICGEFANGMGYALAVIASAVLPQICAQEYIQKVGIIANAKLGQGLLGVVCTYLQFCGILTIGDTRRVKFCQRQTDLGL